MARATPRWMAALTVAGLLLGTAACEAPPPAQSPQSPGQPETSPTQPTQPAQPPLPQGQQPQPPAPSPTR